MPPLVSGKPQKTITFQAVKEQDAPLVLREGGSLTSVQLSYQSLGTLNSEKSVVHPYTDISIYFENLSEFVFK